MTLVEQKPKIKYKNLKMSPPQSQKRNPWKSPLVKA